MRRYMTIMFVVLIVLILSLGFLLFSLKAGNISSTGEPQYTIHVITKSSKAEPDFWRIVEQGVRVAETEYNLKCIVTGPESESDVDKQIQLMNESIDLAPDAIVIAASDYDRLAPLAEKATKAGIILIVMDSDLNYSGKSSLISTDNYELGEKLADLVDDNMEQTDIIGVIGHIKNVSTAVDRREGFLNSIINAEQRVVDIQYCDGSVIKAKEQALEMIKKYPDLKILVGLNETSGLGISYALEELRENGRGFGIKQYSCDSTQEQIQFMENGIVQGFIVQNPFNMGYLSVEAAVNVLDGKNVEPHIYTESVVVTKETMYEQENQKLLFPFNDSIPQKTT